MQRIGATHVGRQAVILKIQLERVRIMDHILDDRAEGLRRGVNFRLGFGVQTDCLGVTAALEIEDAGLRPAMFIIADQGARRIGGERCLAGAAEAEEDGGIRRIANRMIGGAMHRHHPFARQDVVEQGENRFLVLPGIGGAADQDDFLFEIQRDDRLTPAAVARGIGLEAGAVDDGEFRHERVEFRWLWSAQQMPDEQPMPGQFGHNADVQPVCRISAAIEVLDEILAALHMGQHVGVQNVERLRRHRRVVLPPDRIFDAWRADDKFVLGRPACVFAGCHKKGAALAQRALVAFQRRFDQRGLQQVIIDRAQPGDALLVQRFSWVHASNCH